jgi:hypothetical protein
MLFYTMNQSLQRFTLFILCTVCFFPARAQDAPKNWAIGFRIGEPLGVNLRKYFGENHAIDINAGAYGGLWGVNRKYGPTGRYQNAGLSLNANYLWLVGQGRFRPYYGFGGQVTSRRNYPDRLNGYYEKRLGLGGSGLAGVEYFLASSPASLFADVGLYAELLPVPFFFHVQGGVGARFNF